MSIIRSSIVLADGAVQYDSGSDDSALKQREVRIPLTADGSAVRVAGGGSTPASTLTSFASAIPPGIFTATTAVNLGGANSASVEYRITLAEAGKTFSVIAQWSNDNSHYWNEPVSVNGTQTGTDAGNNLIYTINMASRVIAMAMDNAKSDGERFNREAQWLRFLVKSDATTGTAAIFVTPLNN